MQYTEIFRTVKIKMIEEKKNDISSFCPNIGCGYRLEPSRPRPSGSNEYPQCMFWINDKNMVTPLNRSFAFKGVFISRTCHPNVKRFFLVCINYESNNFFRTV